MGRIWSMRFNLDIFNAAYAALNDDQEKAQWLTGFSRGLNAGSLKDGVPEVLRQGFDLGLQMFAAADEFRAKASDAGKKGWTPKPVTPKGTHRGTPQGTHTPNHNPLTNNPYNEETLNHKDVFAPLVHAWNETLGHLPCFARVGSGKHLGRQKAAVARIKEDPNFRDTWQKALAYMAEESWYRGKSFAIDYLLKPGRAQELSEKTPTRNGPAHRREVDEEYRKHMA